MDKTLLEQAKTMIQIGDSFYLDKLLSQKGKPSTPQSYQTLIQAFKKEQGFDIAQQLCKNGNVQLTQFFESKVPNQKDFNLGFVDEEGQNCLHHAVSKNRYEMVSYLLSQDYKGGINVNQQSSYKQETPIFYALGRIKSNSDKVRMVKLLLSSPQIDLAHRNTDHKHCYEAYADQFGFDEASNLAESAHLSGKTSLELESSLEGVTSELRDFSEKQRASLLSKSLSLKEKEKIIEDHIFQFGSDLNERKELQNHIRLSKAIQEKLKSLQNQNIYDPYIYLTEEYMKKELNKKIMEFAGMTLITQIKSYNQ